MAIDYGTKTIGLAVTDPGRIIATALDTVHSGKIIDYLKKYMEKEEIEFFVQRKKIKNINLNFNNNLEILFLS